VITYRYQKEREVDVMETRVNEEYREYFTRTAQLIELLEKYSRSEKIATRDIAGLDGDTDYILQFSCPSWKNVVVTDIEFNFLEKYVSSRTLAQIYLHGYTNVCTEMIREAIKFLNECEIINISNYTDDEYVIVGVDAQRRQKVLHRHITKGRI
jgi:hypothetical protein